MRSPPSSSTVCIALITGAILLVLPPSVTRFRNPPPAGIEVAWPIREAVAILLFAFNATALILRGKVRDKNALFYVVHLLALVSAAYTAVGEWRWIMEFPHLLGAAAP